MVILYNLVKILKKFIAMCVLTAMIPAQLMERYMYIPLDKLEDKLRLKVLASCFRGNNKCSSGS